MNVDLDLNIFSHLEISPVQTTTHQAESCECKCLKLEAKCHEKDEEVASKNAELLKDNYTSYQTNKNNQFY